MYYTSLGYIVLVQVTYKLAVWCFRFPLSRQATHVARITVKTESSVAPIVNLCTKCCAICNVHCSVGRRNRFPAVDYNE